MFQNFKRNFEPVLKFVLQCARDIDWLAQLCVDREVRLDETNFRVCLQGEPHKIVYLTMGEGVQGTLYTGCTLPSFKEAEIKDFVGPSLTKHVKQIM